MANALTNVSLSDDSSNDDGHGPQEENPEAEKLPPTQGHQAKQFSMRGHSRLHVGNITYKNYEKPEGPSRVDVLTWLDSIDYHTLYEGTLLNLDIETGERALNVTEFNDWHDGQTRRLWCHGMPGVGKTAFSTMAIRRIRAARQPAGRHIGLVYVYFVHSAKHSAKKLLRTFLYQLASQSNDLSPGLRALYQEYPPRSSTSKPPLEDCEKALSLEFERFELTYVILDALDECKDVDGGDFSPSTSKRLLETLLKFGDKIKVMVTSRNEDLGHLDLDEEIVRSFQKLSIVTRRDDIVSYVRGRIASNPNLKKRVPRDSDLAKTIENTIADKAANMFLPARLYMNLLVEINSSKKGAIEERLRNLPSFSDGNHWQNYKDAYELILKDIWEQKAADVELARQVFSWVIFSKDPSNLKVSIIQRALQLYEDERTEVEILQICRGLVTIDKKNKNIGFVHYTAATYFENDDVRQGHFLDAEEHMAKACLECILFANVSADFEHSLFRYASLHWGHHAKPVETSVWQQMEDLTNDSERLQRSFSLVGNTLPWDWIMHIVVDQTHPSDYPYAPLHAAAYFGLERFAVSLMDKGANKQAQDHLGFTPMRWAVVGGALNLVNLLLQRDISVLCPDLGGEETLFWAFGSRNSDRLIPTVSVSGNGQLLIGDIWTFSSRPSFFGCFPSPQESRTKQEILAALVKAIDDVDVPRNRDKRTLLSIAAENWQWNVVALLLERRADLDRMDSFGKTPLLWALHCPRQHTVIRQAHVSDASQLRIGRTTIFEAPDAMELDEDNEAGKNIELNICHLIGSNLECVDEMKRTPLSLAVENRLDAVVAHLLEKRADPNHADNNGLTPLHWACRLPRFNNVAIEQLVCHDRSNVELGAVQEQQSIPRVKMGRHKERFLCGVIRLLLSHGAQRHTLDHSKMTPWSMAFAEGLDYSAHLVWDSEQATESEQAKNPNSLQEKQYTKVLLAMLEHPVQFQLKQVVTNDASVLTIDSETKIEHLVTHDSSHAVVRGNSKIEKIMGGDQSQVRIQGSTAVCDLSAYEQSSVDLRGASKVDKAQADDKACITMDGESIITDFHGYGQSSIDLRGTAKVNKVRADDRASLTIDGESNVSDFCAYGQSSINLTGTSKVDKGRADNKAYAKIEGESVAADICAYGESWVDFRGKSTVHKATTEDKAFITMDGDSVVHWFAAYAESRTSLKGNSQINTVVAENKAEIVVDGASNIGSFKGFGESHTVLKGVTMTGRVRVEDKAAIEIEGYSNTESVVANAASCIAIQGEAKIGDIRVEDDATLGIDGDPEISSLETSGRSRTFIRGRPKFGERAVARDESRFAITSRMDRMEGYGPVQIMDRSRAWFGAGDIPISDLLNRRQAARAFIEHGGDEATPQ